MVNIIFLYSFSILFCLCTSIEASWANQNDDDGHSKTIDQLDIFEMDDIGKCPISENWYCKFDIKLQRINGEFRHFSRLEYNRNLIHRGICVPKSYETLDQKKEYALSKIHKTLELHHVSARHINFTCKNEHLDHPTFSEYFIQICFYGYFLLIIVTTMIDKPNVDLPKTANFIQKTIHTFSLRRNIRSLKETSHKNMHFEKLKCVEGIRTYNCLMIIWFHIRMSYAQVYVKDTEYVEHAFTKRWVQLQYVMDLLLIQTFLIIGAWMLMIKVLDMNSCKKLTMKHIFILFAHRISRYLPVLLFYYVISKKSNVEKILNYANFEILDANQNACAKNWWIVFLFVNNNFSLAEMCLPTSWYVSVDVQLYFMSILTLFILMKFKRPIKRSLCMILLISYIINALVIYLNDTDVGYKYVPETIKYAHFLHDRRILILYTMTATNATTYILGLIFGVIYYENKDKLHISKVYKILWAIMFFGLPLTSVYLGSFVYKGLASALVGPLLKPMYAAGFGVGILGMSHNIGGIVKQIFEWKPALFLSKFTFSVYIFHPVIVFYKDIATNRPMEISNGAILMSILTEIPLSFLFGIWNYLIIEVPMNKLSKRIIPNISFRNVREE